jgi:hypothetical protein
MIKRPGQPTSWKGFEQWSREQILFVWRLHSNVTVRSRRSGGNGRAARPTSLLHFPSKTVKHFHLHHHITVTANSMDPNPCWKANSRSATQEIPHLLRNPTVHYRAHKSQSLISIVSQMNPLHAHPISLRSILICSFYSRLSVSSGLFHSDFPTKIPGYTSIR